MFAVFLRAPQDIDRNALLERVKSELFALTEDRVHLAIAAAAYAPVALAVEILRWLHRPASPLPG